MLRQEPACQLCFKTVYEGTQSLLSLLSLAFFFPTCGKGHGDKVTSLVYFHAMLQSTGLQMDSWAGVIWPLWTLLQFIFEDTPSLWCIHSWSSSHYWNCWFLFLSKDIDLVPLHISLRERLVPIRVSVRECPVPPPHVSVRGHPVPLHVSVR